VRDQVDILESALVVGTHNVMGGLRLGLLLQHYRTLRDTAGLDVLCVQENRCLLRGGHGVEIAGALGPRYHHLADPSRPDMGLVYDRERLRCREHVVFPLPEVRPGWLERRLRRSKRCGKYAQVAVFDDASGQSLTVANFHLSTMGGTKHRLAQMTEVAEGIRRYGSLARVVACGDTNAFHWRQRAQPAVLARVLGPLDALGLSAAGDARPTHWFARADEPRLPHQLAVTLGQLGIDLPQRYDVVCTNLRVTRTGCASTADSDHDLVWAALEAAAAEPGERSRGRLPRDASARRSAALTPGQ
jgi:endonuclease/exonuclease/phosphatase family metal-dependent hydrolase